MSVLLTWYPDPAVIISLFNIFVSTDEGITFNLLAAVPFNTAPGAPNYDQRLKQFSYTDSIGIPGNVYQVFAVGADGTSIPEYTIAPPSSFPLCTIYGYMIDAFGNVDQNNEIICRSFGSRGEKWTHNVPGIVGQNPMSLGISDGYRTVFPDQNGLWQVAIIQGIYARIEIPALEFSWVFEVPKSIGPFNIRDVPQLRGQALGVFPDLVGDRTRFPES